MLVPAAVAALCAARALAAPRFERRQSGMAPFNWEKDTIRGVNLGGWLVLEPWINPSLFQKYPNDQGIVDEFTLTQKLGPAAALDALRPHWDSWVTQNDFQRIAGYGFNMVRLPVGYWAYDNSSGPYVAGQDAYVEKAIGWARDAKLQVLIDLHGAPASQNGFDNSGQRLDFPLWQQNDPGAAKTLAVLDKIQSKYGSSAYDDVVMGIELVNEPHGAILDLEKIKQFHRDGYAQQRKYSQERVVVISDAFKPTNIYNGMLTPSDGNAQRVAIDHHEYQVFSPELVSLQPWQHRQLVCNNVGQYNGADKWTFVGEWSAAMTDCAPWLNGYLVGARYDGTYKDSWKVGSCEGRNSIAAWDQTWRDDMRGYIEAQLEAFERNTRGWVFWNFKTEGAQEWDAFALLEADIFPRPLTARKFSQICT